MCWHHRFHPGLRRDSCYRAQPKPEALFEGFGWVTYEVTTPYINLGTTIFPGTAGNNAEITTAPKSEVTAPIPDETQIHDNPETAPTLSENQKESEVTASPYDKSKPADTKPAQSDPASKSDKDDTGISVAVTVVVIAAALTACLLTAVLIFRFRSAENERKRRELIKTACTDGIRREEALMCIADMGDRIMALLAHLKLSPKLGELAVDFAHRADKDLKDKLSLSFCDILPALQKGEFSNEVSLAELRAVADYYNELFEFSTKKNGRINAIYVKYFLKHT